MGLSQSRFLVVMVVMCVAATWLSAGSQQPPTFSTGTRTVAIYATVTSSDGRLVTDLDREKFEVSDNGKPQELTLFANDIQPITVVVLLDRSGSMRANFELVEQAAEKFVDAMLPADKARVGSFANRIQLDPRTFTSDHDELVKILRTELQTEGPTPLWNAVNVGITALLHEEGRRVILVFTDGIDRPMNFRSNNSSLGDVMKRAEEENVMVYAIGLASSMPFSAPPRAPGTAPRGFGFPGGRYGGGMPFNDRPDEGLPKIAAATGGGYFELTSTHDLASTFQRVADELHHQYALGFTPALLDGKMHQLQVKVAQAGTTVRARRSYLAAKLPTARGS
jgi:Ca-activated chloride channel family protein